jgi:hypothetical protein
VVSIKSALAHIMPRLGFCIRSDLQDALCIPARPRCETATHYFSWLGASRARDVELPLLHSVGSVGHIVHSDASRHET